MVFIDISLSADTEVMYLIRLQTTLRREMFCLSNPTDFLVTLGTWRNVNENCMRVPFLDIETQYKTIKEDVDKALADAVHGFQFVGGKEVAAFEKAFGELLDIPHVIATGNGTDALFITLKALGIGPGDEVITPAFSCIPSAETITLCGAIPVFADVDPDTYVIDPRKIEAKFTAQTKAVVAVHLFGQAADVAAIKSFCDKHNLYLIEDCAQAHCTKVNDSCVGTFGNAGAFSFYPTKNLGAYGDAGCVTTQDGALAEKMRRLANHGALKKSDHLFEGTNSRMDTLQAAILLAKLPHLATWNKKRRSIAALYNSLLGAIGELVTPQDRPGTTHTYHIYAIRAKKRDELKAFLAELGIETIVHYPDALHCLPAYQHLHHQPDDFPVANRLQHEILSLPVYPELTEQQLRYVCSAIEDFYAQG